MWSSNWRGVNKFCREYRAYKPLFLENDWRVRGARRCFAKEKYRMLNCVIHPTCVPLNTRSLSTSSRLFDKFSRVTPPESSMILSRSLLDKVELRNPRPVTDIPDSSSNCHYSNCYIMSQSILHEYILRICMHYTDVCITLR